MASNLTTAIERQEPTTPVALLQSEQALTMISESLPAGMDAKTFQRHAITLVKQNPDLLALGNGIRGYESGFDGWILRHVIGGFSIPRGDKIQQARAWHIGEDRRHVGALLFVDVFGSAKGRIAQNVVQYLRLHDLAPVSA